MNLSALEAKAAAQAQSYEDVQAVKALMAEKGIRVEARQRLNTENGFIELVAIFISEKVIAPEAPVVETEEVVPVEPPAQEVQEMKEAGANDHAEPAPQA